MFSSLRANDLIWPYVVNSYLKGKGPPAFDLLYWNSDATNLPGPMFCWYVRHTYLQERPARSRQDDPVRRAGGPGRHRLPDVRLRLARGPHRAVEERLRVHAPPEAARHRFVLGASGHIAGVINPPSKNKRNYWAGGPEGSDPETWLAGAQKIPGSWWPDWSAWLARNAGEQVPAPKAAGTAKYRVIEPAPGRYVKEKAE